MGTNVFLRQAVGNKVPQDTNITGRSGSLEATIKSIDVCVETLPWYCNSRKTTHAWTDDLPSLVKAGF